MGGFHCLSKVVQTLYRQHPMNTKCVIFAITGLFLSISVSTVTVLAAGKSKSPYFREDLPADKGALVAPDLKIECVDILSNSQGKTLGIRGEAIEHIYKFLLKPDEFGKVAYKAVKWPEESRDLAKESWHGYNVGNIKLRVHTFLKPKEVKLGDKVVTDGEWVAVEHYVLIHDASIKEVLTNATSIVTKKRFERRTA